VCPAATGRAAARRRFGSVHRLEVELAAFLDAGGPAGCDGFGACVEFERIGAVLVQIAEHRFFPAAKGVIGQRRMFSLAAEVTTGP